jgi:O-antigen/teichoic acid export membrane protein
MRNASQPLHRASLVIAGKPPAAARAILVNSGSLVGTVAVTSLLGFPYWLIAARAFSPDAVGFAAAAVAAMTLLGTFGMLGLGTLLTGELARRDADEGSALATGLTFAGIAGLALGLVFAVAAPRLVGLQALGRHPGPVALFAIGVALTSAGLVLDQALIGLRRGGLQLWRNALFSAVKLALVAVLAAGAGDIGGLALYATWVASLAASLLWVVFVRTPRRHRPPHRRPRWSLIRDWRADALRHHFLNVALQAPPLAMPLVVTATVSVTANAYYYTASLITGVLSYGAIAMTYALYAVGARDPNNLGPMLRFSLRIAFAVVIVANVVLIFGAPLILRIFGAQYAEHGATVLRILGATVLLMVIKDHYIAIARIRGTVLNAGMLVGAGAVLEIGFGALGGALGGLNWVAAGPLAALALEAAVMSRTVFREAGWPRRRKVSPV